MHTPERMTVALRWVCLRKLQLEQPRARAASLLAELQLCVPRTIKQNKTRRSELLENG